MTSPFFRVILHSNSSHECENATLSNTLHLNEVFGLKAYKILMIGLPMFNCLLNSVCFSVFRSMKPGNQFNRILMYMSICEALFQLSFALHQLIFYIMETNRLVMGSLLQADIIAGAMAASFVVLTAFHLLRNWMVVLISYYRYCSASVPSYTSCIFTKHLRLKSIAFVATCVVISLPRCMEFSVVVCSHAKQVTHIDGNLSDRKPYRQIYLGAILFLAQNVGPVMLLLYFSVCLCHALYRQRRSRRTLHAGSQIAQQSRHNQQQSGTQLVVVLCAVFLICETPTLLKVVDPMRTRLHLLGYTTNLLTCIDSTLNILVYYLSNRQFSQAFRQRLPSVGTCCCHLLPSGQRRASMTTGAAAATDAGAAPATTPLLVPMPQQQGSSTNGSHVQVSCKPPESADTAV